VILQVRVEGLVQMDQGNGEEGVRLRLMDYEGHVKLQVIHVTCEDRAKS
jgi:hypothetical protein